MEEKGQGENWSCRSDGDELLRARLFRVPQRSDPLVASTPIVGCRLQTRESAFRAVGVISRTRPRSCDLGRIPVGALSPVVYSLESLSGPGLNTTFEYYMRKTAKILRKVFSAENAEKISKLQIGAFYAPCRAGWGDGVGFA